MTSAAPLRSGVIQRWLLLPAAGAFLLVGCTSPAKQILTSVNNYHYYHARYQEACSSSRMSSSQAPADLCPSWYAGLSTWHKRLTEANDALQRGGKLPLQLADLKKSEKEAKRWIH